MARVEASEPDARRGRSTPIPIVALDYPDSVSALRLVSQLGESCRFYKVGSELFTASGPSIVEVIQRAGCDVFLDLKLHDIPNTVAGAMRRIGALGVKLATVHASGGRAMIESAVDAAGARCGVLPETILTSLDRAALAEITGNDEEDVGDAVLRLAEVASSAGAHGVVCSGEEAAGLRARFGKSLKLLVPGIRLPGDAVGDQSRIVTPDSAALAGADYVVIGRSITAAADPLAAMRSVTALL